MICNNLHGKRNVGNEKDWGLVPQKTIQYQVYITMKEAEGLQENWGSGDESDTLYTLD